MNAPKDFETARIRRLRFSSLFKMLFLGSLVLFGPFILLCGVAALFGAQTVEVSGRHVTGVRGLVQSLIMIPIFAVGMALSFGAICYAGVRVAGRFFPLTLEFLRSEERPSKKLPLAKE